MNAPALSETGDSCAPRDTPGGPSWNGAGQVGPALRGSETILAVDDDRLVLRLAREILSEAGYTVLEASGGEEALAVVETWPGSIRLLLTDLVMPRMNGFQLSRQARMLRPDVRTLLVSGSPIQLLGEDRTGCSFLRKPFTRLELLQRVRAVLDAGPR